MSGLPPQLQPEITVQDQVHGRIWLTTLEAELVATPYFQRLRHISQLGLAPYVFPTATHTRFAHSLGATHVMGLMLRQSALQEYFRGREHMIPMLRLAALLHDIGHYPFSHIGENVWEIAEQGSHTTAAARRSPSSMSPPARFALRLRLTPPTRR